MCTVCVCVCVCVCGRCWAVASLHILREQLWNNWPLAPSALFNSRSQYLFWQDADRWALMKLYGCLIKILPHYYKRTVINAVAHNLWLILNKSRKMCLSQPHLCNDFEAIIWTWLTPELFPSVHSEETWMILRTILGVGKYCYKLTVFIVTLEWISKQKAFEECLLSVWNQCGLYLMWCDI